MNSTDKSKALRLLCTEVARQLSQLHAAPIHFRVMHSNDDTGVNVIIAESADQSGIHGLQFTIRDSNGGWCKPGQLFVSFSRPRAFRANGSNWVDVYRSNVRVQDPSINVSASKSPKQIAGDIIRRLLPDCAVLFAEVNARIKAENSHQAGVLFLTEKLAQIMHLSAEKITDKTRVHFGSAVSGYGNAKVNGADSVTIELHVDGDQSRRILTELAKMGFC